MRCQPCCASLPGSAQTVTLTVHDTPLDSLFAKIEQQTPYRFIFTREDLQGTSRVSLSVKQAMIQAVLDLAFKDQPLSYRLEDHLVLIRQKGPPSGVPPQSLVMITGKVLNEKGAPGWREARRPGPCLRIESTVTDSLGEFRLSHAPGPARLMISGVNIRDREWEVKESGEQLIRVQTRIAELADVSVTVNTGYQQLPKGERATGLFCYR